MQLLVLITIILAAVLGASGREIPSRIVGGSDAPDGKYPYQVSLRIMSFHLCSGSIINKRWILTAAHCIKSFYPKFIKVVARTTLLSEGGQFYRADLAVAHPKYNFAQRQSDIGLLRVSADIVFNEKVQPIRLPEGDFTDVGHPVTLSGWGTTTVGGAMSNRLQHINLTVISQQSCKSIHPLISQNHICTLTKSGEGACHGDSGGPLTADGVQIGIVSFGRPCAIGYPDVFTKVWTFMVWIQETMEQNISIEHSLIQD